MYGKVDTFEQVEKYIQAQQEKINSWLPFDDLPIPFKIVDQVEQKKKNKYYKNGFKNVADQYKRCIKGIGSSGNF
ncbi:hypothetical protein ACI1UG_10845 [Lactococcus garvieae]|uniref:hypothetical protein n=1 Tax=Lactococcus TaxID=1357 RepID=UPI002891EED6|nr:hypothetical protein [Lactococcus formosensis]MDT2727191.1 hypothetical protein [Lactococcus formosensis]